MAFLTGLHVHCLGKYGDKKRPVITHAPLVGHGLAILFQYRALPVPIAICDLCKSSLDGIACAVTYRVLRYLHIVIGDSNALYDVLYTNEFNAERQITVANI